MYSRFGNPYMRRWTRAQSRGDMAVTTDAATYKGVTIKSLVLVLLTVGIAIATEFALWGIINGVANGDLNAGNVAGGVIIGLILAGVAGIVMLVGSIVMMFKPEAARVFGPIYSVTQGVFLGIFAGLLNLVLPGVSLAALLATGIVFAICLLLYKLLGARIKSRFASGMAMAAISLFAVELLMVPIVYLLNYFGLFGEIGVEVVLGIQAAVALFCVVFATVTVFWDIQNIDVMVQVGADKKYEWILAFSLTTSLIYLYVEILELLVRVIGLMMLSKNKK